MTTDGIETIVNRLREVSKNNFPHIPPNILKEGIPVDKVTQFERERSIHLPEDVRQFLQLINGEGVHDDGTQSGFLMGLSLLSLADIEREMNIWQEVMDDNPAFAEWHSVSYPPDCIQEVYCDPKHWIGLAVDGCGNSIGIDLKPGPKGRVGQVIVFGRDYDDKCVIANNWTQFLDECVSFIERGESFKVDDNFYELDDSGTYIDEVYEKCMTNIRKKYSLDH